MQIESFELLHSRTILKKFLWNISPFRSNTAWSQLKSISLSLSGRVVKAFCVCALVVTIFVFFNKTEAVHWPL